jgi:hypothetical protein
MILYLYLVLIIFILAFIYSFTIIKWNFDVFKNIENTCIR